MDCALTLIGTLSLPAGSTPAPAVVLMHGCSGVRPHGATVGPNSETAQMARDNVCRELEEMLGAR